MRTKIKKSVYVIGSFILAALLFLAVFFFEANTNHTDSSIDSSASDSINPPDSSSGSGGMGGGDGGFGGGSDGFGDGSGGSGGSGGGSGGSGGGGGGGGESAPKYLFRVTSDVSHETMYLRQDSFGSYTGKGEHGFVEGREYQVPEGELPPEEYFANVLRGNGYTQYFAEIELNLFKEELRPYYPYRRRESDVGVLQYAIEYYDYDYLHNGVSGLYIPSDTISAMNAYSQYVNDTYLVINSDLRELLITLAHDNDIYASAPLLETAKKVATYIQNAATYNLYFEEYPANVDMVEYFLTGSKEGVCRHYAAAATMMFRALGIPARYAIGFAIPVTAGEWTEWDGDGHAWTEIYVEGYGWIPLEVTGSGSGGGSGGGSEDGSGDGSGSGSGSGSGGDSGSGSGSGSGDKDEEEEEKLPVAAYITITTGSASKVYDGKPLSNLDITVGNLPENYTWRIKKAPTITNVGTIDNDIRLEIFNEKGEKVGYEVTSGNYGELTVTPRRIKIKTGSATGVYGEVDKVWCWEFTYEGLAEGDIISVLDTSNSTLSEPGVIQNRLRMAIYHRDGKNLTIATDNYIIEYEYGWLIMLDGRSLGA